VPVTFKAAFACASPIWMYAADNTNSRGWLQKGTWQVP
jgi:hypothetical protein